MKATIHHCTIIIQLVIMIENSRFALLSAAEMESINSNPTEIGKVGKEIDLM